MLEERQLLAADVIINEIMYHPQSNLATQEYIELYNKGNSSANLNNWKFTSGVSYTFPNVNLAAGQYLVVAADTTAFSALYPAVANVIGGWVGTLADSGEQIKLQDAASTTIDSVTYADDGNWATRVRGPNDLGYYGWEWFAEHDGLGKSLELVNAALPNDYGQNWKSSTPAGGTPGVVNSAVSSDVAPLIVDVTQFPIIPRSTETVTITARLLNEVNAGLTATINYRVSAAVAPAFTQAPMFDDGAHGDGAAGDGVFGAILPVQINNAVVEYYVSASDGVLSRTWPAPANQLSPNPPAQTTNALYQVDNTFNAATAWVPGSEPYYRIILTVPEYNQFAGINRNSNAAMNVSFVSIDGTGIEVRHNGSVRVRGASSRSYYVAPLRLELTHEDPWNGITEVNLNPKYAWLQYLGSALFRNSGLPAADATRVQVRLNNNNGGAAGAPPFLSYVQMEVIDSDFADNHYPEDSGGNVYKKVRPANGWAYRAGNVASYLSDGWSKGTNESENDWSDLNTFLNVMNNTLAGPNYYSTVSTVANVDQFLRWFAVMTLMGNRETNLSNGADDDYQMYRGVTDPRFNLLPHDLDTIFDRGDSSGGASTSIFMMFDGSLNGETTPPLSKFFNDNEIVRRYYQTFKDLIDTTFSTTQLNALVDRLLTGYASAAEITAIKAYGAARITGVLNQIPQTFSITSPLAVSNGYPRSTVANLSLTGKVNAIETVSVLVRGQLATYTAKTGSWSTTQAGALTPGINRILVQTFSGPAGTGTELARGFIDIWYDDTTTVAQSGELAAGLTTWTAAAGPYRVTADLTVPVGSELVIQPGTSVYFDAGAKLIVRGTLTAVGTDLQHIRFTRTPGVVVNWGGIEFIDTLSNNQLAFFEQAFGDASATGQNVLVTNSQVTFNRGTWLNTTKQILNISNSSFQLTNSTLPAVTGGETVRIVGVPSTGYALVQGNTFAATTGKFDVIGITGGNRPDAIVQILDNTFSGSGDDILDFHGADGHVENNVFLNVAASVVADTNNAIEVGADAGNTSEVTAARNYFYNIAYAYLIKEGSFVTSTNNTIVSALTGVMNFNDGVSASPGLGATVDGDIYFAAPVLFQNLDAAGTTTQLSVSRSITPGASAYPGVGNSNVDPRLTKTTAVTNPRVDFVLKPGSPAIGTGPNGVNMGAIVAAGATISGEPPALTTQNTATLVVGGAGITSYKHRVNGGEWSAETPIATPISLAGLANGAYTVQVVGRNTAGIWQADAAATNSKTWTVDSALVRLLINEVMANNLSALNNAGTFPDAIELYNAGAAAINLAGMSISDNSATPTKFVFPAGTTLAAGAYLVLYADSASAAPGIHLGFALSSFGEGVYLYNTLTSGGALIDSVEFGQQPANLSIGRVGQDQHWGLATPTFGSANIEAKTGNPATLKINEWLATENIRTTSDFLELYNPDTLPVAMGGFYLTDDPSVVPNKFQMRPLSFIAGSGYVVFVADNNAAAGLEHLNFGLSSKQQMIGLFDDSLKQIDKQIYFTQTTDYAQGPNPDGAAAFAFYKLPTPGLANSNSTNVQGLAVIDNLRITEIMYNPLGSANTEYIELRNNSASQLSLTGVRIAGGVDFTFPAMNLAAGAYVLVVADLAAFQSRYGTSLNVAGQFTGSLSNGGEGLVLQLPIPFDIGALRFDYSDAWYPTTDGLGNSLAINSATALANTWGTRGSWHASGVVGGSPGLVDPATTAGLTGFAFRDLNNNGIQDGADPAIGGVTAAVWSAGANGQIGGGDDVLVRTGTSDNTGGYSFFGLAAGNYYIQFTLPAGYNYASADQGGDDNLDSDADPITGQTAVFALAASQYDTSRDVGLVPAVAGASVVGRKLFYNNSLFDGHNPAANASDDAAIATDKTALLNSSTATFANYSSYSRGINGIMVDIQGLAGVPAASDFVFRVGNFAAPGTWPLAPAPQSITVRAGAGQGGSSRVELIWADGAIKGQWLQVTVKAGGNTGLAADDVFYFGNAVGETGNAPGNAIVNATDEIETRNNARSFANPAGITFAYDFDRDGYVNATDQLIARTNATTAGTALQLIAPPLAVAPQVVSRQLFYNNSAFDGNNPLAGASDDAAIATDKTALLPGSTATFANYSSYRRGINGIMVDIQGLSGTPVASDFMFHVGNSDSPGGWGLGPDPLSITTRAGAGVGGSSRVELIWADGAIAGQWLKVTVKAGGNTGLLHNDEFYFGNAIGETGSAVDSAVVNSTDEVGARSNMRTFTNPAGVNDAYDFNRDGFVNATDQIIARAHSTTAATALQLFTAPLELSQASAPVSSEVGVASADAHQRAAVAASLDVIYAAHRHTPSSIDGDLLDLIAAASARRGLRRV